MWEQGPLPSLAAQGLGAVITQWNINSEKEKKYIREPLRLTRVIHLMIQSEVPYIAPITGIINMIIIDNHT